MASIGLRTTTAMFGLFCASLICAQPVPKLVRFSGTFQPAAGGRAQAMESVTLSVYRDQAGGNALWHEIQNVAVDAAGRYSVLMGATENEGMPLDLFTSGEPRWLGVEFNRPGEVDQPRVLLVSVPYALKASDSDTLGGKPASAYLLASPAVGTGTASVKAGAASAATAVKPKALPQNNGIPNYIGKFVDTTDLIDSAMYEVNGNVGIATTTPLISLDVRTGSLPQMGIAGTTDYLTFFASDTYGPAIYWDPAKDMRFGTGGVGLYSASGFVEQVRIQSSTGNVGIGTKTPTQKLDVVGNILATGNINLAGSVQYKGTAMLAVPGGVTNANTAVGIGALSSNTSGGSNTATGASALSSNFTGGNNTATGDGALFYNTASNNTAVGNSALFFNTTGSNNIAIGNQAAYGVGTGKSNNIHIGTEGNTGDSATIRIGAFGTQTSFFVAGVRGETTGNKDAIEVMIDSNG